MNKYQTAIADITDHAEHTLKTVIAAETAQLAVGALGKQIPQKTIEVSRTASNAKSDICKESGLFCEHIKIKPYREYQYTNYKCPVCKCLISVGLPNYCPNCGQRLEW